MLIFGRIPLSPADISLPDPFDTPKSVMDQFLEILARQEVASQHAEAQLKDYQKKMKRTDPPPSVGMEGFVEPARS